MIAPTYWQNLWKLRQGISIRYDRVIKRKRQLGLLSSLFCCHLDISAVVSQQLSPVLYSQDIKSAPVS
jgi:hypothetical protein